MFAEKVKFFRTKLLISQKELAKQVGVSVATITRWESQGLQPQFLTEKKFDAFLQNQELNMREIVQSYCS